MTSYQSNLNYIELPFEQELGFDSYQSSAAECSPNPLDDIFPSPRSAYTPDSPDTSSDIDAIVQDLLSSAPSSPSNSVFSLDNIDTSFNAASQEAPSKPQKQPIQEAQESTPAPVMLSLDSIAPGTIISDGGSNSFELVIENGVRKLVPVVLSSIPIIKTEMASPPASPASVSSEDLNKKLAQNRKASKRYRDKKKADEKKLIEDVERLEKEKHRQELMLERKKAKKELLLSLISQKFSRVVYN